jgi:hypothetical protein
MERRPTTQDVSWFLDQHRNGQLDLEPTYQRRSVWSQRDRRYFLDTLFRGYPSPAIFLHKRSEESGSHVYEVVDGKQRLETILKFVENKIAIDKDYGHARFNGKKWKDLKDIKDRRRFWDYVIPVEFIKMVEGTVVNEVFERLNRNSRKLERQELRHARNDGWLITFMENEAENDEFWKTFKVATTAKARRMKDVQFISELFLVVWQQKVIGFDQDVLDQAYVDLDALDAMDDFDVDTVTARFSEAKDFIRAMDKKNGCVQEYAETATNMYSLWAWAALAPTKPRSGTAAIRYATFMKRVQEYKTEQDLEALLETESASDDAYRYAVNSTGASTEPAQREARHAALCAALKQ